MRVRTVIEGRDPLGYLAALGVVAACHRVKRPCALAWTGAPIYGAEIVGLDVDALLDALHLDAMTYAPSWLCSESVSDVRAVSSMDEAVNPDETDRMHYADADGSAVGGLYHSDEWYAWRKYRAACREGGRTPATRLAMAGGRQDLLISARALRKAVCADVALLDEAVRGDGDSPIARPAAPNQSLRLSHTDGVEYAYRADEPARRPHPIAAGMHWLAFRGMTVTGLITRRELLMPFWSGSASYYAARTAARSPLATAGVTVMSSRIERRGYYGRMCPPIALTRGEVAARLR